jgi:hypothetical protein
VRSMDEEAASAAGAQPLVEAVRREAGSPGPAQLPTVEAACAGLAAALGRLGLDGGAPLPVETVATLADEMIGARVEAGISAEDRDLLARREAVRAAVADLRAEVAREEARPDNLARVGGRRLARELLRRGSR